jgi:hypothetical protein
MSSAAWFVLGAAVGAGGLYAFQQNTGPGGQKLVGRGSGKRSSTTFAPSPNADIMGTRGQGSVKASYADLVAAFGHPHRTDDSDIASNFNEWAFEGPGGVFTIYDTDDAGPASDDPGEVYHWRIGGERSATQFKRWLKSELAKV